MTSVATDHRPDELLAEVAHLRCKLANQPVIEEAKGMLMGAFGLDSEQGICAAAVVARGDVCEPVDNRGYMPGHLCIIFIEGEDRVKRCAQDCTDGAACDVPTATCTPLAEGDASICYPP